jgi:hypothetical protein
MVSVELEHGSTARARSATGKGPSDSGGAVEVAAAIENQIANLRVGAVRTMEAVDDDVLTLLRNFIDRTVIRWYGPV